MKLRAGDAPEVGHKQRSPEEQSLIDALTVSAAGAHTSSDLLEMSEYKTIRTVQAALVRMELNGVAARKRQRCNCCGKMTVFWRLRK